MRVSVLEMRCNILNSLLHYCTLKFKSWQTCLEFVSLCVAFFKKKPLHFGALHEILEINTIMSQVLDSNRMGLTCFF